MRIGRKLLPLAVVALLIGGMTAPRVSAASAPSEAPSDKKGMLFGVAFYNLENLFDTINNNGKYDLEFSPAGRNKWDGPKYRKKIHNLAYAISQMKTQATPLGPAINGCSEIENRSVLEDLVAAEPVKDLGLKIVHHDSPDRRGVDVSLLYNPRFFKVTGVTNHTLFIDSMPWFKTRDQMCVVGRLGDARHPELGAARIAVIVNHWPSRRGGSRQSSWLREAAAALTKHIADSLTQKYPDIGVIVMGDLNDEPTDKSVRETLGAVRNPQETQPGGFYNPLWRLLDEGIGSYIYRGGWDLFDQIIINSNVLDGKCGVRFQNAKVLNLPFLVQTDGQYKGYPFRTFSGGAWIGGYSDHLPTEIFLIKEIKK